LEKSWSKNRPERSEHATGVEPAGDHQWWAVFLTVNFLKIQFQKPAESYIKLLAFILL